MGDYSMPRIVGRHKICPYDAMQCIAAFVNIVASIAVDKNPFEPTFTHIAFV